MIDVMGFTSLLITIGIPLEIVFLLIWIYKIKTNSDIQIEQNNKILNCWKKTLINKLV